MTRPCVLSNHWFLSNAVCSVWRVGVCRGVVWHGVTSVQLLIHVPSSLCVFTPQPLHYVDETNHHHPHHPHPHPHPHPRQNRFPRGCPMLAISRPVLDGEVYRRRFDQRDYRGRRQTERRGPEPCKGDAVPAAYAFRLVLASVDCFRRLRASLACCRACLFHCLPLCAANARPNTLMFTVVLSHCAGL